MATELEQISNYIRQSRGLKVPDSEIALGLLRASWSMDLIKKSFNSLKKSSPVIQVRDLFKEFKLSEEVTVHALNGIYNLDIYEGEFLSISGQSGSGKSTLLNILGIIDTPTAGDIIINGVNVAQMSERAKTKYRLKTLSYIFQFFNLLENYTALENIMFQVKLAGMGHFKAKKKALEILDFLDLADRAKNYPSEMSGGEQQRIAIGRAIAKDTPFVFADEPTAHLDTTNGEKVITLLRQINTQLGKTVVLVSHEPTYTQMADRVVYLMDGRVTKIVENNKVDLNWDEIESEFEKIKQATPVPPAATDTPATPEVKTVELPKPNL